MSRMMIKKVASSAVNFLIQGTKIGAVTFLTLNYVGGFVVCYGPSMEPTLRTHDVLLTEHISPRLKRFEIGDVVVARSPGDNRCICKRVVACPGDTVLYKNETITVPEQTVWLEGDNKGNSNDSRYYGPVPYSLVRRRCFCKVWPQFDLNLDATDRYYLYSSPERQQKLHYNHHQDEDRENETQQQFVLPVVETEQSKDSLEQAHSVASTSLNDNNGSLSRDKVNDERDELFSMMKTSDRALQSGGGDNAIPLVSLSVALAASTEKDNNDCNRNVSDDSNCTSCSNPIPPFSNGAKCS